VEGMASSGARSSPRNGRWLMAYQCTICDKGFDVKPPTAERLTRGGGWSIVYRFQNGEVHILRKVPKAREQK
jgi:hypothetical protein